MRKLIVAGIGTDIGKSVISAILCQKLKADYWKPVQAGNLEFTDSDFVGSLTSSAIVKVHPETYRLKLPMSPHAAAKKEGIEIKLDEIVLPETNSALIIELAGGLLVPLNTHQTNLDLIEKLALPVVVVSKYYLGSINHTLLACHILKQQGITIEGILFNGHENRESKEIILSMTKLKSLGDVPEINHISAESIRNMGDKLRGFEGF